MPVHYAQVGSLLLVAVDGDFTVPELGRVLAAAAVDPRVPSPARVLLDLSGAASLAPKTQDELGQCAALFATPAGRFEPIAILVPGDSVDDMMRVGTAFRARDDLQATPFRSREAAESWLLDGA